MKNFLVASAMFLMSTNYVFADISCKKVAIGQSIDIEIVNEIDAKVRVALANNLGVPLSSIDENAAFSAYSDVVFDCNFNGRQTVEDAIAAKIPSNGGGSAKAETPSVASNSYSKISLSDLMLDIDILDGQKIEVSGILAVMDDMAMLSPTEESLSNIGVDTKGLPRQTRKYLIERCGVGCRVTIRGTVGDVDFSKGIVADELD
ncbi:hypothetical protein [Brucella tritici]|uniref:Uncharacterized protein n=1 Tax=Brucella tritici TaxID=94626 RepID=A0A6L3Y706_9HYPH|nr:hypothetical protein [Brucella tritici]KAB2678079.1 hypothetical protein F9L08_24465 [Brucella tritici]